MPPRTWLVLGGETVSAVGTGATVPYLFVYLHAVCRMSVGQTGFMLTVRAVIWVGGAILGGAVTDRVGAKAISVAGLAATGAGTWGLAAADTPVAGAVAVVGYSLAYALLTPALNALVAEMVSSGPRQAVFGWRFAASNLGAAGGAGLAAVLLSSTPEASGLPVLYLFDGASFVAFALLIGGCVRNSVAVVDSTLSRDPRAPEPSVRGYRAVAADSALRWGCVVVVLVIAAGSAQLYVGIPGLVTAAGLDLRSLGWIMAANAVTVVVFQVPVLRLTASWRRSRTLLAAVAVMAGAWTMVQTAGRAGSGVLVAAVVLFALGETMFAPVITALVNDLAPAEVRGRYNGAQSLAWSTGYLAGAAGAGVVLGADGAPVLFAILVGVLGLAALAVLRLERVLPQRVNMVPLPPGTDPVGATDRAAPTGRLEEVRR